ncbi:MAG: GH39 family glycosyl hydrolase [Verrucomicrobiia bacterium]
MNYKLKIPYVLAIFFASLIHSIHASEYVLEVNGSKLIEKRIRPLHGVNLGPLCYRGTIDLSQYHRELKIPLTRLHDVVWLNADAVDISTIFRDFRDDPEVADNYDFRITDDYIQAIINVGSQIVYRLGESIEHTPKKYRVNPPKDFEKWAKVCLGIIRHYNEGWANGFHHNIKYWEIWNEPDVKPAMWTGTDEQYFELYGITSKLIKKNFPDVKVGGPALGNPVIIQGERFKPSEFAAKFLKYCKENSAPLDFFSWHCYTGKPQVIAQKAKAVRSMLDEFGFKNTESHLNEWNYLPNDDWAPMLTANSVLKEKWYDEMGGPPGAAFLVSVLTMLQDLPVDAANFYTGEIQGFGLFNYYGAPKKNYYAMKAFKTLLETPLRLEATIPAENSTILAGINENKDKINILISLNSKKTEQFRVALKDLFWKSNSICEIYIVDSVKNLDLINRKTFNKDDMYIDLDIKSPAVVLISLMASQK